MSLKLVLLPCETLPMKSPLRWGSILGASTYQAFTFSNPCRMVIDISKGVLRSMVYFFERYVMEACNKTVLFFVKIYSILSKLIQLKEVACETIGQELPFFGYMQHITIPKKESFGNMTFCGNFEVLRVARSETGFHHIA